VPGKIAVEPSHERLSIAFACQHLVGLHVAPESVASLSLYDYGSSYGTTKGTKGEAGTELKWAPRGGLVMFLGTQEDVPGWLIPSVYFDYLRSGDARPLKGIFYHNAMDILAMAGLLNHVSQVLEDPLNGRVEHSLDLVALAKLFEALGQLERAIQLYQHGLTLDLPEENYWDTLQRLSFMHKRQGNWTTAIELWQQAAEGRQIYAHVELAKYFEHQMCDYHQATYWTQNALELINTPLYPRSRRRQWYAELEHRLARLRRKMG